MTTFDTPNAIAYYRLVSLKLQLKLEAHGLKSSGGAIRPRIAKEFGLSARAPRAEYIALIEAKMMELLE